MKAVFLALWLVGTTSPARAAEEAAKESPLNTVISLIGDLEQKIIQEAKVAQMSYGEFADFCEDRARDLSQEITTGKRSVEELEATIEEQTATIAEMTSRIESVGGDAASGASELAKAKEVREKENKEFIAEEQELMETIDMLKRAISALERGASMLQLKNAHNLAQTFSVMVQASLIGTSDAAKLSAFVQAAQKSDGAADDEDFGAPAAAAYESQSGSIVETLGDLLDKAESQLEETRNKEDAAQNNYALLKQSLGDGVQDAQKDMEDAKKRIAAASEKKSGAEGELSVAKKELEADIEEKKELHHDCLSRAQGFESETKSRDAELEVLAKAKSIIKENVQSVSLTQLSFVQVASRLASPMQPASFHAVEFVRHLGHKQGSNALVQLASRMAFAMHSTGGGDPFDKVRGMISDMIAKLEDESSADASKKAYCDKELASMKEKEGDMTDEVQSLDTKGDQMSAKSEKLKEDVADLQSELSTLIKKQAEMDRLRREDKETYDETKATVQKSLSGVQQAIKVLKDYFSQDGASSDSAGAAGSIIGLLEETESKLSAWMADLVSNEEQAVTEYKDMEVKGDADKAAKEADVSYKTKAVKRLAKATAETLSDEEATKEQLSAVESYYSKIKEECIAKPETFEERAKRREAELAGLREALQILENESESSLLQLGASHRTLRRRTLRGDRRHRLVAA